MILPPSHCCVQCFSSIVGPNGSGKSNVIDAMLFVFGYRARKIRSRKVSVLLHHSQHHADVTSCTVRVHFQRIVDLVRLVMGSILCMCSWLPVLAAMLAATPLATLLYPWPLPVERTNIACSRRVSLFIE